MYYNQTELDPEKFMKDAEYLYYFKNLELNHEKKKRNRKLETEIALQINTKGSSHFRSVLINRVEAASGGVPHASGSRATTILASTTERIYHFSHCLGLFLEQDDPISFVFKSSLHMMVYVHDGFHTIVISIFFPTLASQGKCKENNHQYIV